MPEITIKQRKFIEKNRYSLSINEMARSLRLEPDTIDQYLRPRPVARERERENTEVKSRLIPAIIRPKKTTADEEPRIKQRYILLVLAVVTILAYVNSLFGDFISDDVGAILTNPRVGDFLSQWPRPTTAGILNAVAYHLVKFNPVGYHISNLIFHLGTVILVYFVFKLLTKRNFLAGLSALIFALHPIATESVAWISGLPYVAYTFFGLLTLFIVITVKEKILPRMVLAAAPVTFGLAFVSSEKAVAFIPIVLIYIGLFWSKKAAVIGSAVVGAAGLLLAKPLWAIFYQRVLDANPSFAGGITFYNPLAQIPVAISTYTQLFLLPYNLTYYHETFTYNWVSLLLNYLLLLGFLGLGIFFYTTRRRVALFALIIFFLGLAPTLLPIRIAWIVAERYAYLPSVAFAFGAASILLLLRSYSRQAFWIITGLSVITYFGLTIRRNLDWRSEATLWPATVVVSADSTHAHYNMGELYRKKGDLEKARGEYQKAIELQPENLEATNALGTVDLQLGKATEAATLFDKAKSMNPTSVDSLVSLAVAAIQQKKYDEAMKLLTEAQKVNPTSTLVYNTLGGLYFEMGNKKKAIEMLEKALSIDPSQVQVVQNLKYLRSLP